MPRQHPKRFENQTGNRPRKWVNSKLHWSARDRLGGMGLNSAVTYLGVFAGTSSFGPIYAHHGFAASACAAMVLTLVAAGVSFSR
jgi:predicted MFS family arabinose efflux permease